ncbi:MAG: hypothetical protein JWM76_740 [Pseudonocardiales bacterium]|nr:hypothetical protein [Pseudonocardiales bacterium]
MKSPAPAALPITISAAVDEARLGNADAFEEAVAKLAGFDAERVGIAQAAAIRSLLEESFPDGLDGDDARLLLTRCAAASAWYPGFDPGVLLQILSGALGMTDPDEQPQSARTVLVTHAILVITELSATKPAELSGHLSRALAEIQRAETMEMP